MSTSGRDEFLEQLAGAVLDGTAVDWETVASRAGSDAAPVLRYLRLVASVARVHRDALPVQTWGPLRLIERVGRGASGDVFRAWDTRLDREVALKLIFSPSSSNDAAANAIIQEGRLLARVQHPNVVTIHGAERIGGQTGLWMEFVRGRTLDDLLQRDSTFETVEVIRIGIELCRAVSAVHAAGLIHRDIKAHNVMRADAGRILLMDFGAGRELDDESSEDVAGTPLYLAPELFRAQPASVQSDIYSVGVLLYRLASGSYPVSGRSIRELRAAHDAGQRVTARALQPIIAPGLAAVIDHAIEPRPERRPSSADAVAASLATLQRRLRLRPLLRASGMVAALLVIVAVAVWAFRAGTADLVTQVPTVAAPATAPASKVLLSPAGRQGGERSLPISPQPPVRIRPSLQVLPFVNASGQRQDGWFSGALAEMLLREFRASEAFRWIPDVAPFGPFQSQRDRILSRPIYIRRNYPADIVVSGEYSISAQSGEEAAALQLTVNIATKIGVLPTTTVSESGHASELRELIARAGTQARKALGIAALSDSQTRALAASQPANSTAARAYAEGLLTFGDSVPFMERAVAADPKFAPAHIALAEGWLTRRDVPRARAAAARAVELAAALPFEERLIIAARADPISTRIGSAGSFPPETAPTNEIWKQLYARYPDTLLYALQTARGYLNANQFDEGLATVNVISLVPGTADDYDLRQLEASLALGARDYARAQLALDRAAMAATSIGDRPQLGLIRHKQARLALDLGNPAAAASFGLAAKEAGYQAGGNTDDVLAIAFRAIGDYAGARAAIEAGIARDKAQPSYVVLSARLRLASILVDQGALIQARALFGRLMRDGSEGSWTKESTRLALADVLYRRGELSAAQAELDGAGTYHRHRARLLYEQGDLAGAREIVKRSLQILRWDNTGSASQIDWTVGLQARTELASGDTAAARRTIEQVALPHASDKPRRSLQEPERREVFDVAVVRALVALQEAGWGESRAAAETAIALARGDFRADDQAAGECVLALGWLGEGRLIEARAAIARAAPRLRITEDQMLRLSGGIASARVGAAAGTPVSLNQARQDLEALGRQAESIGAVATGFEARLALGEIEVTSAQIAGGRQRLEALAREAKARGFLWIATKATAAAR